MMNGEGRKVKESLRDDFLYFPFSNPCRKAHHEGVKAATLKAVAAAKAGGALISFDPNLRPPLWDDMDKAKEAISWGLSQCDILKIADNELEFMTGETDFGKGAAILHERNKAKCQVMRIPLPAWHFQMKKRGIL